MRALISHFVAASVAYAISLLAFDLLLEFSTGPHFLFSNFGSVVLTVGLPIFSFVYLFAMNVSLRSGWRVEPKRMAISGFAAGVLISAGIVFLALELQPLHKMHPASFDSGFAAFIVAAGLAGAIGFGIAAPVNNIILNSLARQAPEI